MPILVCNLQLLVIWTLDRNLYYSICGMMFTTVFLLRPRWDIFTLGFFEENTDTLLCSCSDLIHYVKGLFELTLCF